MAKRGAVAWQLPRALPRRRTTCRNATTPRRTTFRRASGNAPQRRNAATPRRTTLPQGIEAGRVGQRAATPRVGGDPAHTLYNTLAATTAAGKPNDATPPLQARASRAPPSKCAPRRQRRRSRTKSMSAAPRPRVLGPHVQVRAEKPRPPRIRTPISRGRLARGMPQACRTLIGVRISAKLWAFLRQTNACRTRDALGASLRCEGKANHHIDTHAHILRIPCRHQAYNRSRRASAATSSRRACREAP